MTENAACNDGFPMTEDVEDFAGRRRTFTIDCHEGGLGFTVRAVESDVHGQGYEFAAHSETSPFSALYRVRQKMYSGLSTRHISGSNGTYEMTHDKLVGRITCANAGHPRLVVDGVALDMQDLSRILLSREGSTFKLEIVDALE